MIRTRYGTEVQSIVGTITDLQGQVWASCFLKNMSGLREIHIADLRADNGAAEIDDWISRLPSSRRVTEAKANNYGTDLKTAWAKDAPTV